LHRGVAEAPGLGLVVVDERLELGHRRDAFFDEVGAPLAAGAVGDPRDAVDALADELASAFVALVGGEGGYVN
jgi:hypothetical protein